MKGPVSRDMMEMLITQFADAPEGQVGEHHRGLFGEVRDSLGEKSDVELYDFIVNVANESCCQTSSFIKAACQLDMFYERPE